MKRKRLFLLFVAAAFLIAAGCTVFSPAKDPWNRERPFVVGYTNMSSTDFYCNAMTVHFGSVSADDDRLQVQFEDGLYDVVRQRQQVESFISQKVQAIVIVAADYEGIVPAVRAANAAQIPVIALNVKTAGGEAVFVGSNNYEAGRLQGEYMCEHLPANARIFYLKGKEGLYHSTERLQGFVDACLAKRPDVRVLASGDGKYGREEARILTEQWLQSFPGVDAVVAANDQMALGALAALKAAGRADGVLISGIDGTEEACRLIKRGEMTQSIKQDGDGQAENAYELLQLLMAGQELPQEVILPFQSITAENVDEFLPQ